MSYTLTPAPGTISISGAAIAGTGTTLTAYPMGSLIFAKDIGVVGQLASTPTNDAAGTLTVAWAGATVSGKAFSVYVQNDPAVYSAQVRNLLATLSNGSYATPNATGTLTDRATFDSAAKSFIFWETDVNPFLIFVKQSATSGDWSAGTSIQGATGAAGAAGASGTGDGYDLVFGDPGRAGVSEVVFTAYFAAPLVNYPLNLAGSICKALIAATAASVWSIQKNGVQFATMSFAISGTVATFAGAATSFVAGDVLTIIAPATRDATLSGLNGILAGSR